MLIFFIGCSGSGKDSVAKFLQDRFHYIIVKPYTTRPRRPHEGDTYFFVTQNGFDNMKNNNEFDFTQSYNTTQGIWWYGYKLPSKEEYLQKDYIAIIPPQMFKVLLDERKYVGVYRTEEMDTFTFWLKASSKTIKSRLLHRGDKEEEIIRRMEADKHDFPRKWSNEVDTNIETDKLKPHQIACWIHGLVSGLHADMSGKDIGQFKIK